MTESTHSEIDLTMFQAVDVDGVDVCHVDRCGTGFYVVVYASKMLVIRSTGQRTTVDAQAARSLGE